MAGVGALLVACSPGAGNEAGASAQEAKEKQEQETSVSDSSDPAVKKIDDFIASQSIDQSKPGWKTKLPKPPKAEFDENSAYFWDMGTSKGKIVIKLMPDVAPMHVSSTIYLTRLGFYDDLKFHRVIQGFMAQGGCPQGSGRGSPGYTYNGEYDPQVKHDRPGLLSMANAGAGTDGSQFFLTFVPTPHLNGKHTVFGEIVEGMDTLKELEKCGSQSGATSEPLQMTQCSIRVEAAE